MRITLSLCLAAFVAAWTQTASAAPTLSFQDTLGSPTSVSVVPGGSFSFSTSIDSGTMAVSGISYYLKASVSGKISVTSQVVWPSSPFTDPQFTGSPPVALSTSASGDFGWSTQSGSNVPMGVYTLDTLSCSVDPSTALGSYTISSSTSPPSGIATASGGQGMFTSFSNTANYTVNVIAASTWSGAAADGKWSSPGNWDAAPINGTNLIFAGTGISPTPTNDYITSTGSITFASGASGYTLAGSGTGATVTLGGAITNNSTNAQIVNFGLTLSAPQQMNAASGNLTVGGAVANGGNTLTVLGASNTTLAGAISGTGALVKSGSGTATVSGNNSYGGGTTVSGTGTLIVAHPNALGTASLTINTGAQAKLQAGLTAPVQLPSLTIAGGTTPTATLDVTNNNMVVHNGNITTTIAQLKSGLNASGTLWTGTGIQSSTAATDAAANSNSTVFAVGAIKNIDKNGNLIYSTWPAPPSPDTGATGLATTDVLVKYTYFGDADLNGVVDNTTDYDLWSNGFTDPGLAATNGWLYGDFDFSGIVDNTTDYDLWSTGFAHQGSALAESVAPGKRSPGSPTPATSVQTVPEPGGLSLVLCGLAAVATAAPLMRRRIHSATTRSQRLSR
jgi:autotransporter-associated beta strand protein